MSRNFVRASSQWLDNTNMLVMNPGIVQRTVNIWGRTTSAVGTLAIFTKDSGPGADGSMEVRLESGNVVYRKEDGIAIMSIATSAGISANTHFMATIVTHATDDHRVLLNGGNRNTSSMTILGRSYNSVYIASRTLGGSNFFDGQLSEVAIWADALSDEEIQGMYESRAQALIVRPEALVMYMSMLDDADYAEFGTRIGAGAGARLDFTANGAPTVSAEHPPIVRQAGGLF